MNESEIKNIMSSNHKLLILLGYASSLMYEYKDAVSVFQQEKYDWFIKAVENVIYRGEELPLIP